MNDKPNTPGQFLTPEMEVLKAIEHWLDLQYSFDVAKEAARLGLLSDVVYRRCIKEICDELYDRFKTDENYSSHSEESE